jgi:hypothetical protein
MRAPESSAVLNVAERSLAISVLGKQTVIHLEEAADSNQRIKALGSVGTPFERADALLNISVAGVEPCLCCSSSRRPTA